MRLPSFTSLAGGMLLGASIAAIAYACAATACTVRFARREQRRRAQGAELSPAPVTVLKPLYGDEPNLYENLCSFCDQQYEQFQVVFGVRDARDGAIPTVKRVMDRFPNVDCTVAVGYAASARNPKIATVLNMMPLAKYAVLVLADSDIRVGRHYLQTVVAELERPGVGLVTCLYRGEPIASYDTEPSPAYARLIAKMGALFMSDQFAPSALVAAALGPMDFAFGATIAIRRNDLNALGGFAALAPYLADDQVLGKRVRGLGLHVALSTEVVATTVSDAHVADLWRHELRWARTMHSAQPLGFSFSFLTYPLVLAGAYALAFPTPFSALLFGAAAGVRLALHLAARQAFGDGKDAFWLVPLRDVFGFCVWAAHFFGRDVEWRKQRFGIDVTGQLRED